jgi:hypothetical protein
LRRTVGQLYGAAQPCTDAITTAQASLKALSAGTGDSVTAYQDAQQAHDTCEQAGASLMGVSVPDDLSGQHIDEAQSKLADWAGFASDVWGDMQKVIQNEGDVASAADAKTKAGWALDAQTSGVADIVSAALTLGVDVKSITLIAPQH